MVHSLCHFSWVKIKTIPNIISIFDMNLLKMFSQNVLYHMKGDFLLVENSKSQKNDFSWGFTERVAYHLGTELP